MSARLNITALDKRPAFDDSVAEDFFKAGTLLKKRQFLGGWPSRYFELDGSRLSYSYPGTDMQRRFELNPRCSVKGFGTGGRFRLTVVKGDQIERMVLQAPNGTSESNEWVVALKQSIEMSSTGGGFGEVSSEVCSDMNASFRDTRWMSDAPAMGRSMDKDGGTFESLLVDSMKMALKDKEEEHAHEMLEMQEQLERRDEEIEELKAQLSAFLGGDDLEDIPAEKAND
jgi:hypothetical protein